MRKLLALTALVVLTACTAGCNNSRSMLYGGCGQWSEGCCSPCQQAPAQTGCCHMGQMGHDMAMDTGYSMDPGTPIITPPPMQSIPAENIPAPATSRPAT